MLLQLTAVCLPAEQVMAKSLVRNRHAVNKMFVLKSNLQASQGRRGQERCGCGPLSALA